MIVLFLTLASAFADPQAISLHKGQVAPFDGSLLNKEAVVEILSQNDAAEKKCLIEKDLALATQSAKFEADQKILNARVTSCEESLTNSHAENEKLVKKYNRLSNAVPYIAGVGFVGGVSITILITYAISGATNVN